MRGVFVVQLAHLYGALKPWAARGWGGVLPIYTQSLRGVWGLMGVVIVALVLVAGCELYKVQLFIPICTTSL
ncbi:hypothetical protein EMIT0P218_10133 [Pseudomonas sp. IT-P218]